MTNELGDIIGRILTDKDRLKYEFGKLGSIISGYEMRFGTIKVNPEDLRATANITGSSFILGHTTKGQLGGMPLGDNRVGSLFLWRREKWNTDAEFQAGSYNQTEILPSGNQIQLSGANTSGKWITQELNYSIDKVPTGWNSTWGTLFYSGIPTGSVSADIYTSQGSSYPENFTAFSDGQWLGDIIPSTNGSWSYYGFAGSSNDLSFTAEQEGTDMVGHFKDIDSSDSVLMFYYPNDMPEGDSIDPFLTANIKIINSCSYGLGLIGGISAGGGLYALITPLGGTYYAYDNVTPTAIAAVGSGYDEIQIIQNGSVDSSYWSARINGTLYGPYECYGGGTWVQPIRSLLIGTIPSEIYPGGDAETMELYVKDIDTSWNKTFSYVGSAWNGCKIGSIYDLTGSTCQIAFTLSGSGTYLKDVSLKYNGGNW